MGPSHAPLALALLAVPLVGSFVLMRIAARRIAARREALRAELVPYGVHLSKEGAHVSATGTWEGTPVEVRATTQRRKDGSKTITQERTHIVVTAPCDRAASVVWVPTEQPMLTTPTMAPVRLEGPLGGRFRAATEDPAALARWLGPEAQQALAGVEGGSEVGRRIEGHAMEGLRHPA